ncbi:glycosyltransferase family 61 protein [Leclercia sp. G3L]|uniref:glycosyltransferase family 61 protein n=1 Tax=Leclercia sp. G3L TaxID=2898725 RepID=UPI001E493CE0|nr:glycosyltransferase family 61 protein [Leclercia sp. G3L]UGB03249.1 glycosyltransferase family 61 protein [Leclercia sp. G3L]
MKYIKRENVLRLKMADFITKITSFESDNTPPLFYFSCCIDSPTQPISTIFYPNKKDQRSSLNSSSLRLRAENVKPENWTDLKYNQPMDLICYFGKDMFLTPGGYKQPQYLPSTTKINGRRIGLFSGGAGVFLKDGSIIEPTFSTQDSHLSLSSDYFYEKDGEIFKRDVVTLHEDTVEGLCYFLGNLLPHWGHFLLDGISRLWFLLRLPNELREKLKFICYDNHIPTWGWELLNAFGINERNLIFMKKGMLVKNLIMPLESYRTHISASSEFQCVFDTIRDFYCNRLDVKPTRKVYLSRRNQLARRLSNESCIESLLSSEGYEIIIPESLSVAEQVQLAASSKILIGTTGSGLYLAAFQKRGSSTIVIHPNDFLLFDDFILSAIGHRNAFFISGGDQVTNGSSKKARRESSWELMVDNHLKEFISEISS